MPELAEVETVRRQTDKHLRGRKIKAITASASDRWLFAFASLPDVKRALVGARVVGTGRKGKYFWLKLNRKPWPIFHLGMSGNVAILDPKSKSAMHEKVWGGAKLWSESDQDFRERLWFCRLLLELEGGVEFAFIDPRRFGRMWLTSDLEAHPRTRALGFDPLQEFPSALELGQRLAKRKKSIKSVLLDQSLFAGVGNWLADEILHQARLSPHHLAANLKPKQVAELRKQTLAVVKKAVNVGADYEKFPKNWLFHERWGKNKNARTSRGQKIIHEEIGGRTTAWVPGWQK